MDHAIRKAVIPAAGIGSRLLPLTKAIPKEMLPVGDKPVIEHTVRELIDSGITDITIVVSGGKSLIQEHFRPNTTLVEQLRADGVIAVDADPDAGDLAMRTAQHPHNLSMVELLEPDNDLTQRDFVQRFLSVTDADLGVLASGWRPDSDRVLIPEDIVDIHEIASHYFSMLLWDGDKALNSPLVRTVLEKSNALVLLVEASAPGAVKAGQAIDWLRFHGFEGLLARTVVLVNETTANTRLDLKALMAVLARQQLKMHHIPYDKHLDEGMSIDLAKLNTTTRVAFEDLAAMLADDFVIPQPPAPYAAAS